MAVHLQSHGEQHGPQQVQHLWGSGAPVRIGLLCACPVHPILACLTTGWSRAMAMTVTQTDMRDPRKSQNCSTSYSMMQNTTMPGWSQAW